MTGGSPRGIRVRYYYRVDVMLMCEDSKDTVVLEAVSSKSFKLQASRLLGTRTRIPSLLVYHFCLAFKLWLCTVRTVSV
jgi:hypothetical protein